MTTWNFTNNKRDVPALAAGAHLTQESPSPTSDEQVEAHNPSYHSYSSNDHLLYALEDAKEETLNIRKNIGTIFKIRKIENQASLSHLQLPKMRIIMTV